MKQPENPLNEMTINLVNEEDSKHAIIEARHISAEAGFGVTAQYLISTAVSELATNIIRYAGKGTVSISTIQESGTIGILVIARDNGPGIRDIDKALQDNYSTKKGSLGLGLSSVQRIMDDFEIESSIGIGTKITAIKWRKNDAR